jgi:hypothetical protein
MVRIRNECVMFAGADEGPGVDGAGDADIPGVDVAAGILMW